MGSLRLTALFASMLHVALAVAIRTNVNPTKFLIISAPDDAKVYYARLRQPSDPPGVPQLQVLVAEGLSAPAGIAVDQKRLRLLVTDPGVQMIFSYPLTIGDGSLSAGQPSVAARGTEARWVDVDATGNIFFSDEGKNQILKVSADKALRGDVTPEVVYDATAVPQVSTPGGVVVDNFYAYWVNKALGTQAGSLVKADEIASNATLLADVRPLSSNTDKSYGVCLALNNVFYTQPETTIYGVKKGGSVPVAVSTQLTNPRGCAWDGDGTVYVADHGANSVYSFAVNQQDLGLAQLQLAVPVQNAFDVSVLSSTSSAVLSMGSSWLLPVMLSQVFRSFGWSR